MSIEFKIPTDAVIAMRKAGVFPFQNDWHHAANQRASNIMRDRSHFYSIDTMRHFGSKVTQLNVLFDGLVMASVSSQKADPHSGDGREWRVAIHSCDGWTVDSEHTQARYRTSAQAEKALVAAIKLIKPRALFREVIKRRKDTLVYELKAVRAIKI